MRIINTPQAQYAIIHHVANGENMVHYYTHETGEVVATLTESHWFRDFNLAAQWVNAATANLSKGLPPPPAEILCP